MHHSQLNSTQFRINAVGNLLKIKIPFKVKSHLRCFLFLFFLFVSCFSSAATITSTSSGGTWSVASTWVGGVVPGSADTVVIANGATVTLTVAASAANLTVNSGGTLNIGAINALTISGSFTNNGTFSATSGRLIMSGTSGALTSTGTFTMGAGRLYLAGNLNGLATHSLLGTQVFLTDAATQSISGFTTTGSFNLNKTGGTATLTSNLYCGGIIVSGSSGAVLNLGAGLSHTTSHSVVLTSGTLNGGSSTLHVSVVSTAAWSGTGTVFTAGTGKVVFNALGDQTLTATATTFNHLTIAGSGRKIINTGRCIVNGVLLMEEAATLSTAPTYGASASLIYSTATSRTVGDEWISNFAASGGVTISNTGVITANNAKLFNTSVPLTINSGSKLNTGNNQFNFGGNLVNSGTFTAGSSDIIISGTMSAQTIPGFTTTGSLTMTKTSGTATLSGNVSCNGIAVNGSGGTLNLGLNLTHTSTGIINLIAGTLNASSSILNVRVLDNSNAWKGTGSLFVAGTGTVNFGASGNQMMSASATTFNNLTFSGSGLKTITTANCTVNGIVSIEGTATVSSRLTYGTAATLKYNTNTSRTAGVEWVSPFAATGGVLIANTGAITMNSAEVLDASVPLNINSGATLNTGNYQLNLGGNFTNSGTFNAGFSPIVIDNNMSSQSIAGFSTTGLVTFAKASGTATLTGNISGSGLTVNGTSGTLHLGSTLVHTFSGNLTRSAGTLNLGTSTLKMAGSVSGTGGTFNAGTGTFEYNGLAQNVANLPYYVLSLTGIGVKSFLGSTTVTNAISIGFGTVVNLGLGLVHNANGLALAGVLQSTGSWGGIGSGATNINTLYFSPTTGKINNSCNNAAITSQPTTPSATCSGLGVQNISVTATGSGLTYSWRKDGVALTNDTVVSGQGTSALTLTAPTSSYAGSYDVIVSGTCLNSVTSNAVTVAVNSLPVITNQPTAQNLCQGESGSFSVVTSAVSPTYQWQYSSNSQATWSNTNALAGFSGHNSATLSMNNLAVSSSNWYFRCLVTGSNTCSTYSNEVLLTVSSAPTVGSITGNQSICSGYEPIDDITLSSASGTITWQISDDQAFTQNVGVVGLDSTTLITEDIGVITQTKYIRAQVSNGNCSAIYSEVVAIRVESTTWSSANGGSWSNGEPNLSKAAVISYDYTTPHDLAACSLLVNNNANVVVLSGHNVELNGALTVANGSSCTLNNNANLVQYSDTVNSGNIVVKRESPPLMRQDYILWSSPVTGQPLQSFSPITLSNRFYTYNPATNNYDVISSPSTTNFADANGYLIRMPNNHPTTPTSWLGTFTGVPHNGNYSVPVTSGTYNAVGNPYPSAMDANEFIIENNLSEAVYFWRKTNNTETSSYATYTMAGGVSNSSGDPHGLIPNGTIQVGQGFIVKATTDSLNFLNDMRFDNNDNQFLRSSVIGKSRIWLNLTNDTGYFGQTMIAYMYGATAGIDAAIDGRYINDCQTALTSLVDNEEFSVQGRPLPFEVSDVVSLGFKCAAAGNFSISLSQVDGDFSDNQDVVIYLKDNLTGVVHDLRTQAYNFSAQLGVDNTRFELVYENLLSTQNPTFNNQSVIVYKQNNQWVINSGAVKMKSYQVYDVQGRVLWLQDDVLSSETKFTAASTHEVLMVKITSVDGQIVTQKIMN